MELTLLAQVTCRSQPLPPQ